LSCCSSAKKVKTLNMFKDGKATRNPDGKIIQAASYQSRGLPFRPPTLARRKLLTSPRKISPPPSLNQTDDGSRILAVCCAPATQLHIVAGTD